MSNESAMIEKANSSHHAEVLAILVDAFQDNPVFRWTTSRKDYTQYALNVFMSDYLEKDHSFIHVDRQGAALWLPPGVEVNPDQKIDMLIEAIKNSGIIGFLKGVYLYYQFQKQHPKYDHYYLFAIGTTSAARGKGVGVALMREMLARCDAEQMPAYLENIDEKNLAFYQGHGFEVIKKIKLPRGPSVWMMERQPQAYSR